MLSIQPSRRRPTGVVAGAALVAALACGDMPIEARRPLAGCYHLHTNVPAGTVGEVDALPDSVRLYDVRGVASLEAGRAIVRAWPDSARTMYAWSWWEVATPDTLTLVFSTGFSGVRLALRPWGGDGYFVGSIVPFTDAHGVPPAGSRAWIEPITCAP